MPHDDATAIFVTKSHISCDGNAIGSAHPLVWFTIDPAKGCAICNYCEQKYILKGGVADDTNHIDADTK